MQRTGAEQSGSHFGRTPAAKKGHHNEERRSDTSRCTVNHKIDTHGDLGTKGRLEICKLMMPVRERQHQTEDHLLNPSNHKNPLLGDKTSSLKIQVSTSSQRLAMEVQLPQTLIFITP